MTAPGSARSVTFALGDGITERFSVVPVALAAPSTSTVSVQYRTASFPPSFAAFVVLFSNPLFSNPRGARMGGYYGLGLGVIRPR